MGYLQDKQVRKMQSSPLPGKNLDLMISQISKTFTINTQKKWRMTIY
jgi:hypothetical protein